MELAPLTTLGKDYINDKQHFDKVPHTAESFILVVINQYKNDSNKYYRKQG